MTPSPVAEFARSESVEKSQVAYSGDDAKPQSPRRKPSELGAGEQQSKETSGQSRSRPDYVDYYHRSKLCIYFLTRQGGCSAGDDCPYAHCPEELKDPKSYACPEYEQFGQCQGFNEGKCPYGHGVEDIHFVPRRLMEGACKYGIRCRAGDNCRFAHTEEEMKTGMRRYCYNLDNSVDRKLKEMYPGQQPRKDNGDQRNPPKRLEMLKNQQQQQQPVAAAAVVTQQKSGAGREKSRGSRPRSTSMSIPGESGMGSVGGVDGSRRQSWEEQQRSHQNRPGSRYENPTTAVLSGVGQHYNGSMGEVPLLHQPTAILMPSGSYPTAPSSNNNSNQHNTAMGTPALHTPNWSVVGQGATTAAAGPQQQHQMMVLNYHNQHQQQQEGYPTYYYGQVPPQAADHHHNHHQHQHHPSAAAAPTEDAIAMHRAMATAAVIRSHQMQQMAAAAVAAAAAVQAGGPAYWPNTVNGSRTNPSSDSLSYCEEPQPTGVCGPLLSKPPVPTASVQYGGGAESYCTRSSSGRTIGPNEMPFGNGYSPRSENYANNQQQYHDTYPRQQQQHYVAALYPFGASPTYDQSASAAAAAAASSGLVHQYHSGDGNGFANTYPGMLYEE